jgi:hypothetical protein
MKTGVKKYQALADSIKSVEARKDSKGKDNFDMSDWCKCNCATLPALQCSTTHPTLARLNVSLASAMQLTITIRVVSRRLHRVVDAVTSSHSLTDEHSSSRVPRSEGEGGEWARGLGGCYFYEIALWPHAGTLVVSGIFQAKNQLLHSITD